MSKLNVIETLEEIATKLIYSFPELEEDLRSKAISNITRILLATMERNSNLFTVTKISLNINIEAIWERLLQIYDKISLEDSYINSKIHAFKIARYIGSRFAKLYETEEGRRLRAESEARMQKREMILESFSKRDNARKMLAHFDIETEDLTFSLEQILDKNNESQNSYTGKLGEI